MSMKPKLRRNRPKKAKQAVFDPCLYELQARAKIDSLHESLDQMGVSFRNSIMTEASKRLRCGIAMASILEDALFYARMYKDSCEEGRARREMMIEDALIVMEAFRNGGVCE